MTAHQTTRVPHPGTPAASFAWRKPLRAAREQVTQ